MGRNALRLELQILRSLQDGPKAAVDIKRDLGWDVHTRQKALEMVLQQLRIAGLTEAVGGKWRIIAGKSVCPHCGGRGVIDEVG